MTINRSHMRSDRKYYKVTDESNKFYLKTGYLSDEEMGFDGWLYIKFDTEPGSPTAYIPKVSAREEDFKKKSLIFSKVETNGPDWNSMTFTEYRLDGNASKMCDKDTFIDKLFCGIPDGTKVMIKVQVIEDENV